MYDRSLMDVLDSLSEQLKTSTKDIVTATTSLSTEVSKSKDTIHSDLAALTKAIETKMVPSIDKAMAILEKELPQLRTSMNDLVSALKKVFEIQVIPKKVEGKK